MPGVGPGGGVDEELLAECGSGLGNRGCGGSSHGGPLLRMEMEVACCMRHCFIGLPE